MMKQGNPDTQNIKIQIQKHNKNTNLQKCEASSSAAREGAMMKQGSPDTNTQIYTFRYTNKNI